VFRGRVRPNIRKVQIQGHQDATPRLTRACNRFIVGVRQVFVANSIRNEAGAAQDPGSLGGEVLIDF